ncbi:hypothetical protein TrCOL_g4175 [Triparma columacea]|uniref:Uncharacterized protein n=1 Tax=Triparma columacea TaxID=722753 RepID=A0A9W7GLG6_9STRA|nr:hypothetical protein TrCOL_g4175 [Triparma columacea]
MLKQAAKLRQQAEDIKSALPPRPPPDPDTSDNTNDNDTKTYPNSVLIIGANGSLGSIITRQILRAFFPPPTPVPSSFRVYACVHDYSRSSLLSYEVGAEDGVGTIGPAWDPSSRDATFEYDSKTMSGYNLDKLTVKECEILSPLEVDEITRDVDAVVYVATDFKGNTPRAIINLDIGLLYRAVTKPMKGRVEIEGLRNVLEGMTRSRSRLGVGGGERKEYNELVLVSVAEGTLDDFVTPTGDFRSLKLEGEEMLKEFPSINSCVVRLGKFDDNFVEEGRELLFDIPDTTSTVDGGVGGEGNGKKRRRKINRRDAARAVVGAVRETEWTGKVVEVWTDG